MKDQNLRLYGGLMLLVITGIALCNACEKEEDISEALPCICEDTVASVTGDNTKWTEYLGSDTTVMAFPDLFANYWTFTFARTGQAMGIRVNGEFGDCRYLNLAVYALPSAKSTGSIKDIDILTDCCNDNPFNLEGQNDSEYYQVHIVPEGSQIGSDWLNVITYPANIDSISVFLRYYLPEYDNYGSVGLPGIEAFNTETGESMAMPDTFSLKSIKFNTDSIQSALTSFFRVESAPDQIIRFYNINSDLFYANPDNQYLASPITKSENEVYMIRFKAPVYAQGLQDISFAEVRYWSVTQSDISTRSFAALKDEDAIIARDGFVNIVIADDLPEIRSKSAGLNFIPWKVSSGKMVLIYRNMLIKNGFTGDFRKVPKLDGSSELNVILQAANIYLGDYAPQGQRMTVAEYLENFGSFPVSY